MNRILLLFCLACFSIQCQQPSGKEKPSAPTPPNKPEPPRQIATYPGIPPEIVRDLWEKCDYVDYVLYHRDFSMSQNQQTEIRKTLYHIADHVPAIDPSCQPVGRIFYQIGGENVLEADLFFSPGCVYFIFYQDGKPTYANSLTDAGVAFFNQILGGG